MEVSEGKEESRSEGSTVTREGGMLVKSKVNAGQSQMTCKSKEKVEIMNKRLTKGA